MVAIVMLLSSFASATAAEPEATVTVLVARRDLVAWTLLEEPEKYFKRVRYFKGEEPRDAVVSFDQLKGKALERPLAEDQPLKLRDLCEAEPIPGLPRGVRAMAIRLPRDAANGFVLPGVRVDVLLTQAKGLGKEETLTVVQELLVLAVDMKLDDTKATVTLAVPHDTDCRRLRAAPALGNLRLVVRAAENK
jgi:Flp pilus assembly protein CpaB